MVCEKDRRVVILEAAIVHIALLIIVVMLVDFAMAPRLVPPIVLASLIKPLKS